MRYEHIGNGYRIIFEDEKDFLRCRLLYLDYSENDYSGTISFELFIERGIYLQLDERMLPEIQVLNITRVAEEVFQVPLYTNFEANGNSRAHATETQRLAARLREEQIAAPIEAQQRARHILSGRGVYNTHGEPTPAFPAPLPSAEDFRALLANEGYLGYAGEQRSQLDSIESSPKKEVETEKKSNIKKKSIFDIIDID